MERLRLGSAVALCAFALCVLFYAVTLLRARDYLGCVILVLTGLSLLRAGTELLRPCRGS